MTSSRALPHPEPVISIARPPGISPEHLDQGHRAVGRRRRSHQSQPGQIAAHWQLWSSRIGTSRASSRRSDTTRSAARGADVRQRYPSCLQSSAMRPRTTPSKASWSSRKWFPRSRRPASNSPDTGTCPRGPVQHHQHHSAGSEIPLAIAANRDSPDMHRPRGTKRVAARDLPDNHARQLDRRRARG